MKSTSYLDCILELDNSGKRSTKLYVKRDNFNFPIVNFPFFAVIFLPLLHMAYLFLN